MILYIYLDSMTCTDNSNHSQNILFGICLYSRTMATVKDTTEIFKLKKCSLESHHTSTSWKPWCILSPAKSQLDMSPITRYGLARLENTIYAS